MSALIDQAERDRFVLEQGKNISVIAPAGVGKTTSIVERIVHLARLPEAEAVDRLSRLIVVTYSVRAAQQMQQKARVAIRAEAVSTRVQRAFQQTFFGTIHSYCVRLLERFGHYLGLPSPVALLETDDDLWNRFLLRGLGRRISPDANLRELFHFYAPEKLYALGKEIFPGDEIETGPLPDLDWKRLLDYQGAALHAATKRSITKAQEAAGRWSEAWARGERFRPLPKCPESEKAAAFAEIWNETFAPLHDWLRHAALAFGRRVANAYEAFRLSEAVMTYDDQVRLALRVLDHSAVRRELALERLSVLLDEAQDTDPLQFEVLRRVAGLGDTPNQTDDQSFCIVGDFQQAIYAPRSDLAVYRRVHDEISAEPRGTSSRLRVTFRCDAAIIAFVNRIFPSVLDHTNGQCAFETLVARDGAGPGRVVRWACPDEPEHAAGKKISAEKRARHEARFVARKIQELGAGGLGANGWSQVAILCPRKNWLLEIQRELVDLGLPVQLHSSNGQQRDRTPAAWLTALIWVAAHPEDSFEIAGVLREILGVSDSDMALHTGGDGDKLRLDRPAISSAASPVETALKNLREACAQADAMPLHQAIHQLLEKTHLRERLNSIPEMVLENAGRELDDFLAVVAGRSAEGVTLAELAEELRLGLARAHPAEEEIRDAIQLLTSHKAKGLEWQAVVVPYVFRTIESKAPGYPRVVTGEAGREIVCRDKADFASQVRDFVTERERQQLQRLLYVMSTRAKRTLVLLDDEALFAGSIRRAGWSAAELLGFFGGENRDTWKALPETTFPGGPGSRRAADDRAGSPVSVPPNYPAAYSLPDLFQDDIRQAVARAGLFPHRITPHALAVHARDEAEPEKQIEREDDLSPHAADGPGILYGTWWHEFVQTIPWRQPASVWRQKFIEAQARSPQPDRAAREWELFRRSTLAQWLAEPGRLIQVELPFLWRESGEGSCLEGVMDLAVYTESESAWRVIDWKTNRLGPAGSGGLVEMYRGQIGAYVRALREMLSVEVRGSLYLTRTGEWVEFDPSS
jgi:ATP-dependent helicase/nuclease subunit A